VQAQQTNPTPTPSPEALRREVRKLKKQVQVLDDRIDLLSSRTKTVAPASTSGAYGGAAIFVWSFLCSVGTEYQKECGSLLFFFGAIFNVIAVLVLLYKNST
jgi:hypothetical protein